MKGGYALIDCKGLNLLSDSSQTVSGLFARLGKAIKDNKPVYAANCKWGTNPITPIPVLVNDDGSGSHICTSSTLQIWVASDDSVTIVNMAPSNRTSKSK